MKYLHRVLKAKKGNRVVVTFSEPTRVMLIGDYDYKKYTEHKTYSYRGGNLEVSPHEFEIPNDGRWHIVIERGSYYHPKDIAASVELHS
jgi:hypothetical protein